MILTQLFEVFSTKTEQNLFENFLDQKMTVVGQKWRLFGKIKIFGAGHKIAVGHHFGLDFVVFLLISSRYFPN